MVPRLFERQKKDSKGWSTQEGGSLEVVEVLRVVDERHMDVSHKAGYFLRGCRAFLPVPQVRQTSREN